MAGIGQTKAVVQIGRWQFGGILAWMLWGGVHITFPVGVRNRRLVMMNWFWNWLLDTRDARLITGPARIRT